MLVIVEALAADGECCQRSGLSNCRLLRVRARQTPRLLLGALFLVLSAGLGDGC